MSSLNSWISDNQEEIRARVSAMIKFSQEATKAVVVSFWSELEEAMKHQVKDVVAYVNQRTQGLCKELNKKIDEMQLDLQAMRTSIDKWTRASWKLRHKGPGQVTNSPN